MNQSQIILHITQKNKQVHITTLSHKKTVCGGIHEKK